MANPFVGMKYTVRHGKYQHPSGNGSLMNRAAYRRRMHRYYAASVEGAYLRKISGEIVSRANAIIDAAARESDL